MALGARIFDFDRVDELLADADPLPRLGRVLRASGHMITIDLPGVRVGQQVQIGMAQAGRLGEVVAVETCLNEDCERLGIDFGVRAEEVREANLDLFYERSLLQLEQDPKLVSKCAVKRCDHQSVLIGPLVA